AFLCCSIFKGSFGLTVFRGWEMIPTTSKHTPAIIVRMVPPVFHSCAQLRCLNKACLCSANLHRASRMVHLNQRKLNFGERFSCAAGPGFLPVDLTFWSSQAEGAGGEPRREHTIGLVQSSIATYVKQRGDCRSGKLKSFDFAPHRNRPLQEAQDFAVNGRAFVRAGMPQSRTLC